MGFILCDGALFGFFLVPLIFGMIVANHAHILGIAQPVRMSTGGSHLGPSKLVVALDTETFGVMLPVKMRAFGDGLVAFTRKVHGS